MKINKQPIEPIRYERDVLDVVDIFYTIQGEGPLTGVPSIFVRLAGCILQCPLCDTDYTTNRRVCHVQDLSNEITTKLNTHQTDLVVFTGGEPFRQFGLIPVIHTLTIRGFKCQVETNGNVDLDVHRKTTIICSPKNGSLNSALCTRMKLCTSSSFKYVLDYKNVDTKDGLPSSVLGMKQPPARPPADFSKRRIYVQPADFQDAEENEKNMKATVSSCLTYGYRLCLQTHKIAGLA